MSEKICPKKGGGLKKPSGKFIILFENCGTPTKNISIHHRILIRKLDRFLCYFNCVFKPQWVTSFKYWRNASSAPSVD